MTTLEGCERRVAKRKVATRDPSGDPEEPDLDIIYVFEKNGAPEEIRTPDPQIRSLKKSVSLGWTEYD
ncbi:MULTISPECIES: hypothetical protein [Ensifer]|uniref:hypothetical protein n=1 Tax=Ensifer TaxID=106591 RepID=UPI00132EDC96|nr:MULTISPECIES: hypothetical protein [Ensifer]MBD9538759.1 hypothetical protein [Ensifer sp. ENS04]QHG71365.1 hypothetical protein DQW09_16590 [Ensifer adhaerens]